MSTFYQIQAKGVKLAKRDGLLGKSDPFIVIRDAAGVGFAFSEVISQDLNPTWKPVELDVVRAGSYSNMFNVDI